MYMKTLKDILKIHISNITGNGGTMEKEVKSLGGRYVLHPDWNIFTICFVIMFWVSIIAGVIFVIYFYTFT